MQALSTDIKFDKDVTIPILKVAYLRISVNLLTKTYFKNIMKTILKVFPFYNVFIAFETISFDTTDAFHLIRLHANVDVQNTFQHLNFQLHF